MPYYRKLTGEKCYLSPVQPEDAEKWAQWFNDLEITLPLGDGAHGHPASEFGGGQVSWLMQPANAKGR